MDDQFWIRIFIDQSKSVMELWTLYVLVVTIVIGFVAQKEVLSRSTGIVLAAGFIFVAAANAVPLLEAQSTLEEIRGKLSRDGRGMFSALPVWSVAIFHIALDILVIGFVAIRSGLLIRQSKTNPARHD